MVDDARSLRRHDDDDALMTRVRPVRPLARRDGDLLGVASRGVGLLVKLTLLLILLTVLVGLMGILGVGGGATASVGNRIGAALGDGASTVGRAVQSVRDVADPAHPPRDALAQDTEFDELVRLDVGAQIGGSQTRTLTIASIQRRQEAVHPDQSAYAVIHSELIVPRETRVMGLLVRSTREPRDDYLYKGETFRVGRRLYKVNWVSFERQQVAVAAYRDADRATAPAKFEVD